MLGTRSVWVKLMVVLSPLECSLTLGPLNLIFCTWAFFFVSSSLVSRCCNFLRFSSSVSTASRIRSSWQSGLSSTVGLDALCACLRAPTAFFSSCSRRSRSFSTTALRTDFRCPSSCSLLRFNSSRFHRAACTSASVRLFGACFFSGPLPGLLLFFLRVASASRSSSDPFLSSSSSSSLVSAKSESNSSSSTSPTASYSTSLASSWKNSCVQNSSSASSSSSSSARRRRPRVVRAGSSRIASTCTEAHVADDARRQWRTVARAAWMRRSRAMRLLRSDGRLPRFWRPARRRRGVAHAHATSVGHENVRARDHVGRRSVARRRTDASVQRLRRAGRRAPGPKRAWRDVDQPREVGNDPRVAMADGRDAGTDRRRCFARWKWFLQACDERLGTTRPRRMARGSLRHRRRVGSRRTDQNMQLRRWEQPYRWRCRDVHEPAVDGTCPRPRRRAAPVVGHLRRWQRANLGHQESERTRGMRKMARRSGGRFRLRAQKGNCGHGIRHRRTGVGQVEPCRSQVGSSCETESRRRRHRRLGHTTRSQGGGRRILEWESPLLRAQTTAGPLLGHISHKHGQFSVLLPGRQSPRLHLERPNHCIVVLVQCRGKVRLQVDIPLQQTNGWTNDGL
mmetsp:Transcript_6450/g.40303  ORF Transcript_6450/g.40303 Transcript_6450/m.40303 type:complete len:623 (-) Transcript_6450:269-2137(-)